MARPRVSEDDRRSECFAIRLTPNERIALQTEAERLALTPTELARQKLVEGRVVVRGHRQLSPQHVFTLGRIGVNLNQIARTLNSGRAMASGEIDEVLRELRQILAAIIGEGGPSGGDPAAGGGPTAGSG